MPRRLHTLSPSFLEPGQGTRCKRTRPRQETETHQCSIVRFQTSPTHLIFPGSNHRPQSGSSANPVSGNGLYDLTLPKTHWVLIIVVAIDQGNHSWGVKKLVQGNWPNQDLKPSPTEAEAHVVSIAVSRAGGTGCSQSWGASGLADELLVSQPAL